MKIEYLPKPRKKARLKQLNKANRILRRHYAAQAGKRVFTLNSKEAHP